jgi:hypothetical protein
VSGQLHALTAFLRKNSHHFPFINMNAREIRFEDIRKGETCSESHSIVSFVIKEFELKGSTGRAIAQEVSRRLHTMAARVLVQVMWDLWWTR